MGLIVTPHARGIPQRLVTAALGCAVALAIGTPFYVIAGDQSTDVVDFNRDVQPILASHCLQCHGPDARARQADLRLDTPTSVFAVRDGRRIIDPESPEQSELLIRITSEDADERMPPPDSPRLLSARQIDVIRRWIKQGALWKQHWSLTPPSRPRLPAVSDSSWPRNGVDFFVLARLEQEGRPASIATIVSMTKEEVWTPSSRSNTSSTVSTQRPPCGSV